MNISKFTQKSMEAVQGCEKLAYEYGNQEIEQEHLLYIHSFYTSPDTNHGDGCATKTLLLSVLEIDI